MVKYNVYFKYIFYTRLPLKYFVSLTETDFLASIDDSFYDHQNEVPSDVMLMEKNCMFIYLDFIIFKLFYSPKFNCKCI